MTTVALSSSDGRFDVTVAGDDAELIASMLLLFEVVRVNDGNVDDAPIELEAVRASRLRRDAHPCARPSAAV